MTGKNTLKKIRKFLKRFILITGLSGIIGVSSSWGNLVSVVVIIDEIKEIEGQINIQILKNQKSYEAKKPDLSDVVFQAVIDVTEDKIEIAIKNLKEGIYAVKLFQDLNYNGKLDMNSLGIPKEPFAFSNNARGTFGPPDYEKVAFSVISGEKNKIEISLK